jgi:hypothetical protein
MSRFNGAGMVQDRYLKVKKFGVASVAKIFAVLGVVLGIIVLVFAAVAGAVGGGAGAAIGLGVGIVILIFLVLGLFVGGAIESFLYNVIASIVGPIRLTLDKRGIIGKIDPLSYAKIAFVFSLIVFGIIALAFSSTLPVLLGASPAMTRGVTLSLPLVIAAFIFALLVYGFIVPVVWATVYNWLAEKIGGVRIVLEKGVLKSVDIGSYVKIAVSLSIIIFIVERIIGTLVGLALGIHQIWGVALLVTSLLVLVVGSVVANALAAWFYNLAAKKVGGIEVDISR